METRNDKHYKWVMLGLLAFTYFLMHATRQVFNASFTDGFFHFIIYYQQ